MSLASTAHPSPTAPADFVTAWTTWHDALESARREPHSFLALTGIHFLTDAPQRFADAPGSWTTGENGPVVELADGESLVVDGEEVTGRHVFGVIPERVRLRAGFGDAVVELSKRGGQDLLRPLHPENPLRTGYQGTPAFAPDPRWVVQGSFVPWAEPRELRIDAAVDGIVHTHSSPGVVEFAIDGQELSLIVFDAGGPSGSLFTVFTDSTSGITTYSASRTLHGIQPSPDGRVVLDFTRVSNLQCAYTPFAPCPLAPRENRLPVAIEAGEQIPHGELRG
ncbi:DUF1684 domain-containing protein [Herbiconiux sp. 11R-BC]|uniref:DUF1684 domain-containing protein n=1 Tax=Herbiconiux sp. 11R-BC TaxID=3111637 RepID=UPI003C02DEE2